MKTYNQILQLLANFAVQHAQVNSNGNGFQVDINDFLKNNPEGAFLFFQPLNIDVNDNTVDYILRIYSLDFKQKDNDNINDVLSDSAQILIDLRKHLIYNENLQDVWSIQFNRNRLTPVNNYTADFCAGWFMDITISTPLNQCDGDIPLLEGGCPEVLFFINETLVGQSVNNFFIEVVNEQGEQVGELIDGQWVVPSKDDCFPINLVNRSGCLIATIGECPEGGEFTLPRTSFTDDGGFFADTFIGGTINIINGNIETITESIDGCETNLTLVNPFPISIRNSSGCTLDSITVDPNNSFTLNDISLQDTNGVFGTFASPAIISIDGAEIVNAVIQNNCDLKIEVNGGGGPTIIIPRRLSWQQQQTEYTPGDTGYWYAQGAYEYNDPAGLVQDLDWNAADPDNIWYTLKYPNIFGGNRRFTTSTGIAAGGSTPADFNTANWSAEVAAGGIDQYVIDHLTGIGYLIAKVTIGENWFNSVAAVHSLNYGGFTDWRPLTRLDAESIIPFGRSSAFYSSNCILTRGDFFVTGNETQFWLGDTRASVTANAMTIWDSGDVRNQVKDTGASVRSIFACRTHF